MNLNANVGSIDKIIRYALATIFAILIFTKVVTGVVAIILGVLAVVFVATSLISFCPIWSVLKVNTDK